MHRIVEYPSTTPLESTRFCIRQHFGRFRNGGGEPVRIPIEQNIWRWVWLGVAILVLTLAIALAMNQAPHRRSPRTFGPHLGTVAVNRPTSLIGRAALWNWETN